MLIILGVIFGGLICKLTAWALKASLELWKAIWHFLWS